MSAAGALPIPLSELQSLLRGHGVVRAQLFGSYARGEQTASSDVDLLIDPAPGVSLLAILALEMTLEARTGIRFELTTKIRAPFRPYIEPELIDLEL